jgi:hypothetical protein
MIADDVSSKNEAIERWNNRVNEPKWIPVEQQKPTENGWYLVFFQENANFGHTDENHIYICYWNVNHFDGGALDYQEGRFDYTHWMPLPEMPKG